MDLAIILFSFSSILPAIQSASAAGTNVSDASTNELVIQTSAVSVYSVVIANGDRYYTVDPAEAAQMAQGVNNVFEGVLFDALDATLGGRQMRANYNPFTSDWYFAADGQAMPYFCYEPVATAAGFTAAPAGNGPGTDFHLFMNSAGITQLLTETAAAELNLVGKGFTDRGAIFNTTTTSAFVFDAEAYLIANQADASVQALVDSLSTIYNRTSDAGFVEAVEHDYLTRVALVGVAHGGSASTGDLNAVFGTAFLA